MTADELYEVIAEAIAVLRKDRFPKCILDRELVEVLQQAKYNSNRPTKDERMWMVVNLANRGKIEIHPTVNDMSYYLTDK